MALLCAVTVVSPASAQPPAAPQAPPASTNQDLQTQVQQLREQLQAIQDRLATLEQQMQAQATGAQPAAPAAVPPLGGQPAGQPPVAPPSQQPATPGQAPTAPAPQQPGGGAQVPPGAAGAGGPEGTLPVYGNTAALSKVFNPDIAVIGNFVGAAGKNDVDAIPPFQLHEAEMSFQAVVDPYARADFFFSAGPEGLDVEEGFITFPSLPGGVLMKVGEMKAQFGKVNTMHSHVLPWVDVPLAMTNLLGGEEGFNDSGISVSKLILNPVLFLEATGEVFAGGGGPFATTSRSQLSYNARLRGYRDVTESTNIDVGTSFARGHNGVTADSTTRLFGVDATIRYRPLRRAIYRRFIGRTELFWSRREDLAPIQTTAFGGYVSGDYQFAQRWFAGGRYDWSDHADNTFLRDKSASALLTYWPSEFSQIRGQFRRTAYGNGPVANELLFQFLFSIGAHGAHVF